MKKNIFYILPLLLLLCSCAATDRALRMSGGVVSEYSAPKSFRLRSEKYQAKTRSLGSDRRMDKSNVSGMNDTLVNIWPFFFASNNYWCALWPMIDCDPYGFAVRPFFNKEGDDWSVLFPLSAWNSADKSGWAANFFWEKQGFGFFPLTYQSWNKTRQTYYYTPLFFLEKFNGDLTANNNFRRTDRRFFAFLTYGKNERYKDLSSSPCFWLFARHRVNGDFVNEWKYRCRNGNIPGALPKTESELHALKEKAAKNIPTGYADTFGVFPLFHAEKDSSGNCKYTYGVLLGNYKHQKDSTFWSILCGLLYSSRHDINDAPFALLHKNIPFAEKKLNIAPLLISGSKTQRIFTDKRYRLYQKFTRDKYYEPFSEALPRLKKQLKQISPEAEIPEEVTDWNTFEIFRSELAAKEKFTTEEHSSLLLGPFFYWSSTPYTKSFIIPVLLSGKTVSKEHSSFHSIPLLTFSKTGKNSGYTNILPPLVYMKNYRKRDAVTRKIHPRSCKWGGKYTVVEEHNQYAALGLFYRGRHAFSVVKEGFDAKKAEFIRNQLNSLGTTSQNLHRQARKLAEQKSDAEQWIPKNKIEHYKKLIRLEELKIEQEKLAERQKENQRTIQKVKQSAAELGLKLEDADFADRSAAKKAAKRLLDHTAELRWKEDIGNGIFFRKEKFYNGDHNWHFCHILAGGSKNGSKESTHILHLLYRSRKDGNRSETIFFPFISHVKEGSSERTSFLWKVFSIGKRSGKTGGYILFIPFGERI